jgi:hypothetical protein
LIPQEVAIKKIAKKHLDEEDQVFIRSTRGIDSFKVISTRRIDSYEVV